MSNIQQSVTYLRSRSLAARHAMLWGGSLVIFFAVSLLWVGQMKYKLATAFQFGPGTTLVASSAAVPEVQIPVASNPVSKEEVLPRVAPAPSLSDGSVNGIVALIEKGTAGLFSLLRGKGIPSDPASRQEGQELDQFLKYQKEYYRPLPASQ